MNTVGPARALAACALLLSSSCGGTGSAPDPARAPRADACAGAPPSYRNEVAPLLERYCLGCHARGGDAGEDHDFTSYEVLHAQRRVFWQELEAGAMPPRQRPQPALGERQVLTLWACWGAPNN